MMEAVILTGIQASGKSTFCRNNYWDTHLRLNYDMLKTRRRENLLLEAFLKSKQSFVVDSTNPTAEDREKYIIKAKAAKFKIIGIELHIDLKVALERNSQRIGKVKVPDKAIVSTFKKMVPMSCQEGFDEIFIGRYQHTGYILIRKD